MTGRIKADIHYRQGGYFQPRFGLALFAVVKVAQTVGLVPTFAGKAGVQARHFFRVGGDYPGVADAVELDKIQPFAEPAAVSLFRRAAVAAQVGVVGHAPKAQQADQQPPENFFFVLTAWTFFLKSFLVAAWVSFWGGGGLKPHFLLFLQKLSEVLNPRIKASAYKLHQKIQLITLLN